VFNVDTYDIDASLVNWTPKVELRGWAHFDIPEPRELHMPSRYYGSVAGSVGTIASEGPEEFSRNGTMTKNTLPDNFVPPLAKESYMNEEVANSRRMANFGG